MGLKSWKYKRVGVNDDDCSDEQITALPKRYTWQRFRITFLSLLCLVVLVPSILFYSYYLLRPHNVNYDGSIEGAERIDHIKECHDPMVRKEWRTLDPTTQSAYISAVRCLMHHPSIFLEETSFYDDLIFAHSKTGSYSHYAAAFLPWHRLYMHVYEQALRQKCEYTGALPYWDWTLDFKDLSSSPIWDSTRGFGGNGDFDEPEVIHGGHCVMDGQFSNSTRAWSALSKGHSHNVTYWPHCMCRGFATRSASVAELDTIHYLISPKFVEETLDQPDYDSFFRAFESGAHNAIPQFIKGDWLTFTAPNDPVFFLHHTQVDRLWWIWQNRDPQTRLKEFHGPAENFKHHDHGDLVSTSSKTDLLPMAGLVGDTSVDDVMDTVGGYLCYVY